MNSTKYIIAFLILIFSLSSQATFKEATEYYDNKQFQQAFSEFEKLAKIGHKPSQFNLGVMYLEGTGTEQDFIKAHAWIKLSDENSQKEGKFLEEVEGYFKEDNSIEEASLLYNSLKSQYGHNAIIKSYKPKLTKDKVVEADKAKTVKTTNPEYPIRAQYKGIEGWVTVSMQVSPSGYPTDMRLLESVPEKTFEKTALKALRKWRFEPTDDDFSQVYKYRMQFILGDDNYERLGSLKEKAVKGDPKSQYLYGKYGFLDSSVNESFNPTLWYFESARNGVVNAQYEVGKNLLEGKGCEPDLEKAISWLTISSASGYAPSKFELSKLSFGSGNTDKGVEWLREAFDTDDLNFTYRLIHYSFQNDIKDIEPDLIISKLDLLMDKKIKSPVNVYRYYAWAYATKGEYEKSLEYLNEAIENLEDLGEETIPQDMLDRLAFLEAKVS